MTLLLTLLSIVVIAALVRAFTQATPLKVCALCAGVFLTWCGLLVLRVAGYAIDPVIPAILMGGSAVGIAFQLEKRLPKGRSALAWKTFFVLAGFTAAYGLIASQWPLVGIAALLLLAGALLSGRPSSHGAGEDADVKKLENKLKNCC